MSFSPLGTAPSVDAHLDGAASSSPTARALPNFASGSFAGKQLGGSAASFDARPQQVYVHRVSTERRGSLPPPAVSASTTATTEARRASLGPGIALLPRSVLFSPHLERRGALHNSTTHVILTRSDLALMASSEDVEDLEERRVDGDAVEGQFEDAEDDEDAALPESPTLPASPSHSLLSPKTSSLLTPRSPESATLDAQLQSASLALEELRESVKDRPRPRSVLLSSSSRPGSMMIKAHRRFSEVPSVSGAAAASDDAAFAQWKAAFAARHFGGNVAAAEPMAPDTISPLQLAPSPAAPVSARDAAAELTGAQAGVAAASAAVDSPVTRGRRRRRDENRLDAQAGSALSEELHLRAMSVNSVGSDGADAGHGSPREAAPLGLGIFVEERSEPVEEEEVWHEAREVIDDEGTAVKLNQVELPAPVGKLHQLRDLIHEPGHAADIALLPQAHSPKLPKLKMRPQPRSLLAAAHSPSGGVKFVPRHWNLTNTASPSGSPKPSSAAAKKGASTSDPCPPSTTANKTWTSALANSNNAWSSPKASGSPAMPNSATSTPLMAQTPTMASLPASPMMPQSTDMPAASPQPDTGAQHAATPGQNAQNGTAGAEHQPADSHLSTATMVAASAAGAVLLIFAFIWAILARKRRNKRRRHLSGVLRKFGDGSEKGDRNGSVTLLGGDWVNVPDTRAPPPDAADNARRSSSLDKPNAGIDNVSYFSAQQRLSSQGVRDDELTVINSWLPVEGGGARGTRISTDLARSGIVSASPSKDASFTWQHPTLSLPPAAARALATSHYIKKRATMPVKAAASATDLAASASSPGLPVHRHDTLPGGAPGDDSFCTSLGEALASSNCLADTLHASSGASSTSDDTAPAAVANRLLAHAYSASVSTSSASGAERTSPWLSTILRGVPKPVASTPPRGGMARFSLTMRTPQSLPSIASRDGGSPSGASSGTDAGEVRFVTKTAAPARRTLDVGASQSSARASRSLMKGRTRASTLSRLSFVQLPEPARAVSVDLPRPVKISAPLVVISRPTETPPVSSSLNKRMSLWRTSLSTCREDSRDSLAGAVSTPSTTKPIPAHLVTQSAPLQQGTFGRAWALQPRSEFDSSEDELRQGYEAGEETEAETVFAVRYLSQSPSSPASSYVPSTSGGHSSAPTSLPPTPTKGGSANSSLNGVHKRAPRLPPMPLITLTLDDGLVQRPLSLTSDSSSESEHSADDVRDRRSSVRNARPASAVTTARLALQNAGGGFDEDEDDAERCIGLAMTGDVHSSASGRVSRAATRRMEREKEEEGYGSDSIEGCLEFDDFPTMPRIIAAAGGRRPSY